MNRRGFFHGLLASFAIAAAKPIGLFSPAISSKIEHWAAGFPPLTKKQADGFVEMLLDQTLLSQNTKVCNARFSKALQTKRSKF